MFNFGKAQVASQSTVKADAGASFIGAGCFVTGDIECQSSLRIDGVLKGNISGDGHIEISATGVVEGQHMTANSVIVHGKVNANINAKSSLRICKNGQVDGDINAESLDIESGAHFVGYSHTGRVEDRSQVLIASPTVDKVK